MSYTLNVVCRTAGCHWEGVVREATLPECGPGLLTRPGIYCDECMLAVQDTTAPVPAQIPAAG